MRKRLLLLAVFFLFLFFPMRVEAQSVSVNGEGGVNASYGEAWLKSLPSGEGGGNFSVGQTVSGDWAVFHCTQSGSQACATDLTPAEAEKVAGGRYEMTVPAEGERAYIGQHAFDVTECGRVQYDFGVDGVGTVGGWVYDYGVDCRDTQVTSSSCSEWEPLNTQFRVHTGADTAWISGGEMRDLSEGDRIDVNCFAKNGGALLKNAKIRIKGPTGTQVHDGGELRDFTVRDGGEYRFTCYSASIDACSDTDSVTVASVGRGGAVKDAVCDSFEIDSGNDELAPRTVRFRTTAHDEVTDNLEYRYHWGDGRVTSGGSEADHRYETGGNYYPYVEVKGESGNWVRSDACEQVVTLKTAAIAAHRSGCSEVDIVWGNNRRAPTTIKARVRGYDNKGEIQGYRLMLDDQELFSDDGTFEVYLDEPGTWYLSGYIQDSEGEWVGGDGACRTSVQALTDTLAVQPKTGVPVAYAGLVVGSGVVGVAMRKFLGLV